MTKGILRVCNREILLKGLFHGCFLQSILFGWALFSVQGVYADLFSDWILKYSVPAQTSASLDWTLDTPGVDYWYNEDVTVNSITIGNITINTKNYSKIPGLSYAVAPGVSLELVEFGSEKQKYQVWKLKFSGNTTIEGVSSNGGHAISSSKALIVELSPGSFTHLIPAIKKNEKPIDSAGIRAASRLLIYGPGTLSISHLGEKGSGISAGNVLRWGAGVFITEGASVRIQTAGVSALKTSYNNDGGGPSVAIVGALLETTGGKVHTVGDMLIDRAAVNVLAIGTGLSAWGDMTISKSFCASMAKSGNAIYTRSVLDLKDSVVYAMSKEDSCVEIAYNTRHKPSRIGKGRYRFATLGGSGKSAIDFNLPLTVDGADLATCAPDGYGMHSTLYDLTVDSGVIRNQYSMHIKDEFFVSRELMDAYDFVAGWEALGYETSFNPYEAIALFLGYTMLDWIEAQGIDTPRGNAVAALSSASFCLNGGSILSEASEKGIVVVQGYAGGSYYEPVVKGGSLLGPIIWYDMWGYVHEVVPVSERTTYVNEYPLVCVTNTVVGKSYNRVTSGWTAKLPSTYDTSSLYLDGQSRLYFWVPEEYAQTTPSFTVTFNANGGTGTMAAQTFTKDVAQNLSANAFTRPGYTFKGWATSESGSVVCTDSQRVTVSADTTLFAVWSENVQLFTVTFNANSGTGTMPAQAFTKGVAQNLSANAFTRLGYTFKGWATSESGSVAYTDGQRITISTDTTLFAVWSKNVQRFTVTFNANGGTGGTTRTVDEGSAIGTLPSATKTGYMFVGWWTSSAGGTQITESTKVTANVTYYAHWVENSGGGASPHLTGEVDEPWTATKAKTLYGAMYDDDRNVVGVVQLKVAKPNARKGTTKVSGYVMPLSGKKVTLKATTVSVPSDTPIVASVGTKTLGTLVVTIGDDGFEGVLGSWKVRNANVGGNWTRSDAKVYVDFDEGGALPIGTQTGLLPAGEPIIPNGGKWAFAKPAQVKWAKNTTTGLKGLVVNVDKGKTNISGMKLAYTPNTGIFKGSFKIYTVVNEKLKTYTAKVNGIVVDGDGFGLASLKKFGEWSVFVGADGPIMEVEEDESEVIDPFDTDKVTTLPGDDPIVSTDGTVSTADFKTWITGIAVVKDYNVYYSADLASLPYVSPQSAISVSYGQAIIVRVACEFPYAADIQIHDEWPNGDEPTYNPLSYNPFGPWITGKGISYGFISYDEKSQPFTVRFISVGTRPSALIDGFPTWEYDGTVHASSWRSSVTPVNIQFGR